MGKILVVDDDPNILKVIKMRLEAERYQVITADQAGKAKSLAKDNVFDFALIDLKLNGEDGIELMENLHQINPEMPVIILTAYGTIKSAVKAMRRGAYSYITKPFDYDELLVQTRNCLEKTKKTCMKKNMLFITFEWIPKISIRKYIKHQNEGFLNKLENFLWCVCVDDIEFK